MDQKQNQKEKAKNIVKKSLGGILLLTISTGIIFTINNEKIYSLQKDITENYSIKKLQEGNIKTIIPVNDDGNILISTTGNNISKVRVFYEDGTSEVKTADATYNYTVKNSNSEETLNAVKTEFEKVEYEDLATVLNPYIRALDKLNAKTELTKENNGVVPTEEEITARVTKKYMERLDMKNSFNIVKANLDTILKGLFERSTNINNDYVLQNKNNILLGLTYLERQYKFDLNGIAAKDLILFLPEVFGNTQEPLSNLITIGTLSYTDAELINNLNTYTKKIAPIVNKTNMIDFIETSLKTLEYDKTYQEWFKSQTKAYIYETTSNNGETSLYNKMKNNDNLKRYLIPLLTLTEKNIYAISTSKTINFGLSDTYIDKTNETTTTSEFLKILEETAKKQEEFLSFWYRISNKKDTLKNYDDIIVVDTMQKYNKNNETASQLWSEETGENALSGVREFMTPLKLYNSYMTADGEKTSATSFVLYLAKSLTDRGQSVYTHEITHILDEVVWFNGYGRREGKDVEVFARGLFESLNNTNGESGYSSIFNLNTTYEITDSNRTQNQSPQRFQTEADLKQYMQGMMDVLYTLDYAEAQAILSKQDSEKALLFNKVELIQDPKDSSKVVDNFVHITEEEAKEIQNINDVIEKGLVSGRLEYKGNLTTGMAESNGYYVIPLFEPIYAGIQNNTGATGDVTFRRNSYDLLGEYGYHNGMAAYLSNQYANDSEALNAILDSKYNGSLVEFKKDMFSRRISKVSDLKATQYFNNFAELQEKMNEAVDKDLAIMTKNKETRDQQSETDPFRVGIATGVNNVKNLKLEIYQEYLNSTNDFRSSIYEDKVSSNIIYVMQGQETSQEGNGTEQSPYQSLLYAVEKAKDGDTIKLLEGIEYRQQVPNETFKINKNITIDGQNNSLSFRGSNIEVLANVKFTNMTLNIIPDMSSNDKRTKIYVSGNEVTFDNVSTRIGQSQDDERPMLIGGAKEGSPIGPHTKINILNGSSQTRFRQIIVGNENSDSSIPATINISSEFAKVDNGIYLGGAENYKVTGKVILTSNSKEIKSIEGTNSTDNEVIITSSTISNLNLGNIKNLKLIDGAKLTLNNFIGVSGNLDIKEGTSLWIHTNGEVQVNNILGTGEIVISTDTLLTVKQDIIDAIKIKLEGFESELQNNINKIYVNVNVNGNINSGVTATLYIENDYYTIKKEANQYKLVSNFDKNNIKKIEVIQSPDNVSYTEGQKLDLTGLILLLTDSNNLEEMVGEEEFSEYNVTFEPNSNTILKTTNTNITFKIGQKSVSLPITVVSVTVPKAQTLTLNTQKLTMYTGYKTQQLVATITPSTASKELKWETNDDTIATVNESGVVTSKNKVGSVKITAKTKDGSNLIATCDITVVSPTVPLIGISLNKTTLSLQKGKTETLSVTYNPNSTTDSKTVTWTTSNAKVATVVNGKITAVGAGEATITAKVGTKTATCKVTVTNPAAETKPIGVKYYSHIENYAWESAYKHRNGATSGITGKLLKVEAIKIQLENAPTNAKILYKAHVQDIGWEDWKSNGAQSGTTGQNKKVEAIRIKLENLSGYSVMYRAYVEGQGWKPWVADGIEAGSTGKNLKLEAIQIKIVKTSEAPKTVPGVQYYSHIENIGWENRYGKVNGQTSGIVGKGSKVEAICLQLTGVLENASIEYQAHVQDIGWQKWQKDGNISGTTGQNKKIEAIRIKINNLPGYSIMYRAHVQNIGWMPWVADGIEAGTTGKNLKLEAIEVKIVKTSEAPKTVPGVQYYSHIENIGWENRYGKVNGQTSGVVGRGLRLEAMCLQLTGILENASIEYQAHVQDIGWQKWVKDGNIAGTTGKGKKIEAIRIKVSNLPGYSIMYRAHVQNIGWQPWVADGNIAGTTGRNLRLEAIQVKVVKK